MDRGVSTGMIEWIYEPEQCFTPRSFQVENGRADSLLTPAQQASCQEKGHLRGSMSSGIEELNVTRSC
jgi:hypothetical protein